MKKEFILPKWPFGHFFPGQTRQAGVIITCQKSSSLEKTSLKERTKPTVSLKLLVHRPSFSLGCRPRKEMDDGSSFFHLCGLRDVTNFGHCRIIAFILGTESATLHIFFTFESEPVPRIFLVVAKCHHGGVLSTTEDSFPLLLFSPDFCTYVKKRERERERAHCLIERWSLSPTTYFSPESL